MVGRVHAVADALVGNGIARHEPEREDARPDRKVDVGRVVLGRTGPDLRRRLVDRDREDVRLLQLLRARLPRIRPAARDEVVGDRLERGQLLGLVPDEPRPARDHYRAVVHRVVEDRPREHDPVEQGHRDADVDAVAHRSERPIRGQPVDDELVTEQTVGGRDDVGLPVLHETHVAHEPLVEDRADRRLVVDAALGESPDARPFGRSGDALAHVPPHGLRARTPRQRWERWWR